MTSSHPSSDEIRRNRAEELFLDFLEEDPVADSLEAVISRHPDLANELRALAEAHELASAALGEPEPTSESSWDAGFSDRYEIRGELARGGMGVILEVWDRQLRRSLAMKILRNLGSEALHRQRRLSRLINEAQVLGQLDHPGIVPVHEVGRTQAGDIFFTMQLVRGVELGEIFERIHGQVSGWMAARGVGILVKVAEAVAFAHSRGVVHRDLKPANVMVGPFGETYVMDWGLAKVSGRRADQSDLALSEIDLDLSEEVTAHLVAAPSVYTDRRQQSDRDPSSPELTFEGDIVGTPAYMSPEQALGRVDEVDHRSDIYATGAMLYHLLVGHAPYADRLPVKPSPDAVLQDVLLGPPTSIERLAPKAPAELVAITTRAMARDPIDRYATQQELAEDLRAFLENRVVAAHRSGAVAELAKWIRRNRGAAAAVLVGLLSLIVLVVLLSAWNKSIREARDDIARQAAALQKESYSNTIALASSAQKDGDLSHARDLLESCTPELRNWEWFYLKRLSEQSERIFDVGAQERVHTVALSADGRWIAAGTNRFRLLVWSDSTGELEHAVDLPSVVDCVEFSPDSKSIAIQCRDRVFRVFDLDEAHWRFETAIGKDFHWLRYSPSGDRIALAGGDGYLYLVKATTGEILSRISSRGGSIRELVWSPDEALIYTAGRDGFVREVRIETQESDRFPKRHDDTVKSVVLSPDGKRLASGDRDGRILIWNAERRTFDRELSPRGSGIQQLSWSPDGSLLAGTNGSLVRVWSTDDYQLAFELHGHGLKIYQCAFSAQGDALITGSQDGTVRLWSVTGDERRLDHVGGRSHVTGLAMDQSGSRLAIVTNSDHEVKIWSTRSRSLLERIEVPRLGAYSVAWLGDRLVLGGVDGHIRLLDVASGELVIDFPAHHDRVLDLLVHPDGRRVFSIGFDSLVAAWDLETGRELWLQLGRDQGSWWPPGVLGAVLLPDRDLLATSAADSQVKFWSLEDGKPRGAWQTEARVIDGLDVSPDGRFLLGGGYEPSRLLLWEIDTGRVVWSQQSSFNYRYPKFSSDGSRIFSGGVEGALGIWDAETGRRVVALPSSRGNPVFRLDVSKDDLVVTGDDAGIFQFWSAER